MAVMHTYPILNISETYIRQCIYDSLPAEAREKMTFEEFRDMMSHDDYRYFAASLSDLINDYVVEKDLFAQFIEQAVDDTVAKSEKLSELFV